MLITAQKITNSASHMIIYAVLSCDVLLHKVAEFLSLFIFRLQAVAGKHL